MCLQLFFKSSNRNFLLCRSFPKTHVDNPIFIYNRMPPKKKSGSSKSKEKKLKRKQEQAEVAAALAKVKAANDQVEEYMSGLPAFQKFVRNELDLVISLHRMTGMTKEDIKWAFDLMKECVEDLYVNGGWGWNDRKKWEELSHDSACFLIARDKGTGRPVGFVNFRFDLDDNVEVVYCYEVHLCPDVRRKGLGKFLMQILELIGHKASMKKIVLTVFKENAVSNAFFRDKMKYIDDDTSPIYFDPLNEDDYTYSILSKPLVKKPAKPVANPAKPVKQATGQSAEASRAENQNPRQMHKTKATTTTELSTATGHSSAEGGGDSLVDTADCNGRKPVLNGGDENESEKCV